MGMAKFNIEIMLKKRNIKTFSIIADNHFVFLDVLGEIIQVLPLHISFNRLTVVNSDCGNFVEVSIQSGGFNIQIYSGISEFRE